MCRIQDDIYKRKHIVHYNCLIILKFESFITCYSFYII